MSESIYITPRRAKLSAAHSLPCFGDDHPCARKHGHTWWVQATFAGTPIGDVLIDYSVVADVAGMFDHRDLDEDEIMLGAIPTGENILMRLIELFEDVCSQQESRVEVVRIELTEDPIPGDAHSLVWVRPGWDNFRP